MRVPDPAGNHGEQRGSAPMRPGLQHDSTAGQHSNRCQRTRASQAQSSRQRLLRPSTQTLRTCVTWCYRRTSEVARTGNVSGLGSDAHIILK